MKKILLIAIIVFLIIGIICGSAVYWFFTSKEYHSARSIAQTFAAQEDMSTNVIFIGGALEWTKRGDYNLSHFLFFPKGTNSILHLPVSTNLNGLILVRYTTACPTNTFEVGVITNSNTKNYTEDAVISSAKFINPSANP